DLEGLKIIRENAPTGMRIAAGEYGYDSFYFRKMLEAGAVDVLQADATRCAGITGFLAAGNLCTAFATSFSAHTAPSQNHIAAAHFTAIGAFSDAGLGYFDLQKKDYLKNQVNDMRT
ncbi:MAG: enolase C-terminal domain-like protein, partial [Gammaproteobacteria bacterium]